MLNRIPPAASPSAYKTYQAKAPIASHWTTATCAQVACEHWTNGWAVRAEYLSAEDLHLVTTSGRKHRTERVAEGETWLVFEAGQPCFAAGTHLRRLEREELFVVRDGDWRANPTGRTAQLPIQSWVDDFGEHQDRLDDLIEKYG